MKKEQQRIAIAEACGWKWTNQSTRSGTQSVYSWYFKDTDNRVQNEGCLPDYLNDLNAMHEAEKVLPPSKQKVYQVILEEVVCGSAARDSEDAFFITHATATQRGKAFLKTIGTWVHEPMPWGE